MNAKSDAPMVPAILECLRLAETLLRELDARLEASNLGRLRRQDIKKLKGGIAKADGHIKSANWLAEDWAAQSGDGIRTFKTSEELREEIFTVLRFIRDTAIFEVISQKDIPYKEMMRLQSHLQKSALHIETAGFYVEDLQAAWRERQ